MFDNNVMAINDAPLSKWAEVYVEKDGNRYKMLMCKEFKAEAELSTQDVPRMGSTIVGKKVTSVTIPFSMTIYKCTEIFDDIVENFIKKGVMPTFTIQCSNEDPSTSIGRTTKVYNDCTLDGNVLLSLAGSEDDYIEQEISGFAGGYTRPEKVTNPTYM